MTEKPEIKKKKASYVLRLVPGGHPNILVTWRGYWAGRSFLGISAFEYGMLASLIIIVIVLVLAVLAPALQDTFNGVKANLQWPSGPVHVIPARGR